jgi:hypothetical protein
MTIGIYMVNDSSEFLEVCKAMKVVSHVACAGYAEILHRVYRAVKNLGQETICVVSQV